MSRAKLIEIMINYAGNILRGVPGYTVERGEKLFWVLENATGVKFIDIYKHMAELEQASAIMGRVVTNPLFQIRIAYSAVLAKQITDEISSMIDEWGQIFEDQQTTGYQTKMSQDNLSFELDAQFHDLYDPDTEEVKGYGADVSVAVVSDLLKTRKVSRISVDSTTRNNLTNLQNTITAQLQRYSFLGILILSLPNFQNLFMI